MSDQELERQEWLESLEAVREKEGSERVTYLLNELHSRARQLGVEVPPGIQTPYINTIPPEREPEYPGNPELEERICNLTRWNALAMVVRANREETGIGGHISTYASCATLYEVGYDHFFRGRHHPSGGDHIYFQGHAAPGNYARAFLEGRLTEEHLQQFRREVRDPHGISSYPHPWLMPDFWEFPTVSMGLGPIQAMYRARFMKYLENRGITRPLDARVWAFIGDGECDEPETMGSLSLAPREGLDNLIFVVNCNLQRLDGPVRGNGKIIQELEAVFRGAGWNVIKLIWGSEWDPLFARDTDGALVQKLGELVDGEYQKLFVEGIPYARKIFGSDARLVRLIEGMTDEEIGALRVGGHDRKKIYAAYKAATESRGRPTVILAKTIKGYGLGEAGEGRNITHQQKKMTEHELRYFRDRFRIPISDEKLGSVPFYRSDENSEEARFLRDRRQQLGGFVPQRKSLSISLRLPERGFYDEFLKGSERPLATTMVLVRLIGRLMQDKELGKNIVPIVPDEARTFGMDSFFRQFGIYSSIGQRYEPVDVANVLYYKEAKNGQLLEEGITEAGAMSSFIAAGTSHAYHRAPMVPFYLFYSMFGFQRIGDLIWAAGDIRARGFLIGATAGRTTLAGEGLQHQDGHSHVLALPIPNLRAYDPAFAHEIAVIVEEGLRRMHQEQEDVLFYLTVGNEPYHQPAISKDRIEEIRPGILRGLYRLSEAQPDPAKPPRAQLLGSGAILNESLKAQALLSERFGISADVWSVTSYKELHRDALATERRNLLHPLEPAREPYVASCLREAPGVIVAASDYLKALPDLVAKWLFPRRIISLGTDGYGRSDNRALLRDFFEVDARHIAFAAISALVREGSLPPATVEAAVQELGIDPERLNPAAA